jgi:hypothetical protein
VSALRTRWTGEGLRWRIAWTMDRIPRQCWADLVSWVQDSDHDAYGDEWWARLPWRPRARTGRTPGSCEADAARCGTCYCGKVRTAEADAQMQAGGAKPGVLIADEDGAR